MATFLASLHKNYLLSQEHSKSLDSIGFYLTSHLRVGGGYWTLTALHCLCPSLEIPNKSELIKWLLECQNPDGGFGGNVGHDSHITSTHYALLILFGIGEIERIDKDKVAKYINSLRQEDGSIMGDISGEIDARFSYCAVSALDLLGGLKKWWNDEIIDKVCSFIEKCRNFDGGYGGLPDMESHGAYAFCCIGTLKIANQMNRVNIDQLALWLSERQTLSGGFNGRPEKLPDVCYSWWIFATLKMIGREDWIDQPGLEKYILNCQDAETGGIADKPGNCVDVFHTFFGLATLSLLDKIESKNLQKIDPTYALPITTMQKYLQHLKISC